MEKSSSKMSGKFEIPDNLEDLTKEELIALLRKVKNAGINLKLRDEKTKKQKIAFDFKRYKKRHVALKFLYLGWDYAGFAVQVHTDQTIEGHLFNALIKTKLIESRETSSYHRCGRTDKGVSAFSQVVSLDLRSNLLEDESLITPENFDPSGRKGSTEEIDYPSILNRVLPPEIKVIAWAPVEPTFSARFDCLHRTYKYWFPIANLNIEKMRLAAQKLVGEHDFRNLCKMDVSNGVIHYIRKILNVEITPLYAEKKSEYDIAELTINGQAFLWHQIRCIVSVLFLIGQGKEDEQVIEQLLDVHTIPRKPQYNMASEIPLVLFDSSYDNIKWIFDETCLKAIIRHLQSLWTHQHLKSVIIRRMLQDLEGLCGGSDSITHQAECLLPGVKSRVYKRLLERPCCESLEERIEHYSKKAKHGLRNAEEQT